MGNRIDNLHAMSLGLRLRGALMLLACVGVFAGALGIPLSRLKSQVRLLDRGVDADSRLPALRQEHKRFLEMGGMPALEEMLHQTRGDLPHGLSRIDLHASLLLFARRVGLELEVLSVGPFQSSELDLLADVVDAAEVSMVGHCEPEQLGLLVELLRQLGYPAVLKELQLTRSSTADRSFQFQATLSLFQASSAEPASQPAAPAVEVPQ